MPAGRERLGSEEDGEMPAAQEHAPPPKTGFRFYAIEAGIFVVW